MLIGWLDVRREEPTGSGEHGDVDIIALVNLSQPLAEEVIKILVEGIQLVGPIESNDRNAILVRESDELFV